MEREKKPSPIFWVTVMLAIPLLYILSVPWVETLRYQPALRSRADFDSNYPPSFGFSIIELIKYYRAPYRLLRDTTPLRGALLSYELWCVGPRLMFEHADMEYYNVKYP